MGRVPPIWSACGKQIVNSPYHVIRMKRVGVKEGHMWGQMRTFSVSITRQPSLKKIKKVYIFTRKMDKKGQFFRRTYLKLDQSMHVVDQQDFLLGTVIQIHLLDFECQHGNTQV